MSTIFLNVYGTEKSPIQNLRYELEDKYNVTKLLTHLETAGMLPKRFIPQEDFGDLLVFINRQNIICKEWGKTILKNGDRVLVVSAVAGG